MLWAGTEQHTILGLLPAGVFHACRPQEPCTLAPTPFVRLLPSMQPGPGPLQPCSMRDACQLWQPTGLLPGHDQRRGRQSIVMGALRCIPQGAAPADVGAAEQGMRSTRPRSPRSRTARA